MLSSIYGAAITQFEYGMEICAPKFRMPFGISANFVFTAGLGLLSPIAHAGTNWGNMSIVIALLPLLILPMILFSGPCILTFIKNIDPTQGRTRLHYDRN